MSALPSEIATVFSFRDLLIVAPLLLIYVLLVNDLLKRHSKEE